VVGTGVEVGIAVMAGPQPARDKAREIPKSILRNLSLTRLSILLNLS
jgi:hypothetical protein